VIAPLMPTYARADLLFERGEGARLYTPEGECYLDFGAGVAVNALGHGHPRVGEAIRRSSVPGVSFGWYPTGLNTGHELEGNYLRGVDAFPDMLRKEFARLPRIVYEFDAPDLHTGTMYPAMARTFREVGAQFAAMFAYDMLRTASRNLGWQTHYLNLVYTPRKAMTPIIAAEAMPRLPRLRS
jgi:hypothetical protein